MRAKEFLTELRASRTAFSSILKDQDIQMGFECEMMLNGSYSAPSLNPNDFNWEHVEQYLTLTGKQTTQIDKDFDEWLDEWLDEGWSEVKDNYISDWCARHGAFAASDTDASTSESDEDRNERHHEIMSVYEDDARDAWERTNRDRIADEYNMNEWIGAYFGSNTIFIRHYGITPDYGWTEDNEIYISDKNEVDDPTEAYLQAADSIQRHIPSVKQIRITNEYHQLSKKSKFWYIEPDATITTGGGVPAEVVSSVYQIGEGIDALKQLFEWMTIYGHSTDTSTGLHINLSIKGKDSSDYDYLKMMIFFDENYTATLFSRLSNVNAKTMRNQLSSVLPAQVSLASTTDAVLSGLLQAPNTLDMLRSYGQALERVFNKYVTINSRQNGVYEFRIMGGEDYEQKFDIIRQQIVHMAYILKVGSDDTLFIKEYVSKVIAMLNAGKYEFSQLGSGKYKTSVPKGLDAFAPLFEKYPALAGAVNDSELLVTLASIITTNAIPLSRTQLLQLQRFIISNKIKENDWKLWSDRLKDKTIYNTIAAVMGWELSPVS